MPSKINVEPTLNIFPPRPGGAINPSEVDRFGRFLAQYKYNDIRTLIHLLPGGEIKILSRKKEALRSYTLTALMKKSLRALKLKKDSYHVLDGGLMRSAFGLSREKSIVLWDILVHENQYLLLTTYAERYRLLETIAGCPRRSEHETGHQIGLEIRPHLWLAPLFRSHFSDHFKKAEQAEDLEGLVLKNPRGKLRWGSSEENNGEWQIRVRKTNGRYVF
jgi:ATP-dependent DNA ligase